MLDPTLPLLNGGMKMKRAITRIFLWMVLIGSIFLPKQMIFAADNTVKILIGDGTESRHHMSLATGSISDEYHYEIKGYTAQSSEYTSSDTSVFKIVKTGEGKCKIQALKEGTGLVTLTIKTTDKKTLKEQVFISSYTPVDKCQAITTKETNIYRGATTNAGVENNDKNGSIANNKKITVLAVCNDFYYIQVNESTKGFVPKSNIQIPVSKLTLKEKNISLAIGERKKLRANVVPDITTDYELQWDSENTKIADINTSQEVCGITEGTTSISVSVRADNPLKETTYVSVYTPIKEIQGYLTSATDLLAVGNSASSLCVGKAKTNVKIVGTCGDYYRVKINEKTVNEKNAGYCYVLKTKITIPVTNIKISSAEETILVGETWQISAAVEPALASNQTIHWSSGDKKIATVSSTGVVSAKKEGDVTITATSDDGKKQKKCIIHVRENNYARKQVQSKPYLTAELCEMNSISWEIACDEYYDGYSIYLNDEYYDDISYCCDDRLINNLDLNKKYKIKVRAFNKNSNDERVYGKYSNVVTIVTGKNQINVNAYKSNTINIKWSDIEGVKNYQIYRSNKKNGKYKVIKTVKGTKTSYTDKTVKKNKTYYYKVIPVSKDGIKGTSNIDYAKAGKVGNAKKYITSKYPFICTENKKKMNSYNVKGVYSPVKYKMTNSTLEIHVYLEFVTYTDTGKTDSGGKDIYKKNKASVKSEISTKKYISMFKDGIRYAYSDISVAGGNGNFKKGIQFDTKLVIHEKDGKTKYNPEQKFIEVLIGGECPNCTSKGDHWYHCGPNRNASGHREYGDTMVIYMPTNEQVRKNNDKDYCTPVNDYCATAAHELGHAFGLMDAYPSDQYDRCADNSETGKRHPDGWYDNLMKYNSYVKQINANGIEMMLRAVDRDTGIPEYPQYFKSFDNRQISDVIINTKDYEIEK